jgi:biopolymer transport protein ExbD
MPKVKVPRKSISLDMTAMCDMAFLLLTFFMLTTKFKPEEPLIVDAPSSISDLKLPEKDILVISIGKEGQVFFGVDGQHTRIHMLDKMAEKYGVQFTDAEKHEFSLLPSFGTPVGGLKQILNLGTTERSKVKQPGIPCDSANNELKDWVLFARVSNESPMRIAIKGDKQANYSVVKQIIATLQEQNINKFNLVTTLENKPSPESLQ